MYSLTTEQEKLVIWPQQRQ